MTPEELDKARAVEARRLFMSPSNSGDVAMIAARLAREGWQPTPKPSPRVMAMREWLKGVYGSPVSVDRGDYDSSASAVGFLAGYAAAVKVAEPVVERLKGELEGRNGLTPQGGREILTTYLTAIGDETR